MKVAHVVVVLLLSTNTALAQQTPKTKSARLAFVGDVMMHKRVQQHPAAYGSVAPLLKTFDWVHANLESPLAPGITTNFEVTKDPGPVFDDVVYTDFPRFNAHSDTLLHLKEAGIRMVSTANNHAMDRGSEGVDLTIDSMQLHHMPFTGTRRADTPDTFHNTQNINGFSIAFLACTYATQGPPDRLKQVSLCSDDTLSTTITGLAKTHDAVIVLPHWGDEYQAKPNKTQRDRSRVFLNAGALAVVATHPHVLQPLEFYTTHDGRHTVIAHSLGNFVGHQMRLERRTSVILELVLQACEPQPTPDPTKSTARACISATRIHPIHTSADKIKLHVSPIIVREQAPKEWDHVESVFGVCMMLKSKSLHDCKVSK